MGDSMLASGGAALLLLDHTQWKALCSFLGNDVGSHYCLGTAMAAVSMCVRAHVHCVLNNKMVFLRLSTRRRNSCTRTRNSCNTRKSLPTASVCGMTMCGTHGQVGGTTSVAVLKGVGVRPFILGAVGSLSVALAAASAVCFLNSPLLSKPRFLLTLLCWVRHLFAA